MSDYPMLISNKLHSFRNFILQRYEFFAKPCIRKQYRPFGTICLPRGDMSYICFKASYCLIHERSSLNEGRLPCMRMPTR